MSELLMSVIAGPSHPNSGELGSVHVFGGLYVGGSAAWRFGSVLNNPSPYEEVIPVALSSGGSLVSEIRAGVTLCLNIGAARSIASDVLGPDWADSFLELPVDVLDRIGAESRNKGVGLLITSIDESALGEVEGILDDDGWSVMLCGPRGSHLQTQWDRWGSR
ncbi:MAG: hypothetical protein NTX29_13565 [Actinobacteria bacterium]|nr:hypothetical protein [Actinomycetota bacterium]